MSKFNSFEKNEFLPSNAREKYKIVTESYFLYAIVYSFQWLIMQAEHYCYRARVNCLKIEQICKDGVPENGHTTFVLVKNILTWTNVICPYLILFREMVVATYISLEAVGSTMGLFWVGVYGFKAPN